MNCTAVPLLFAEKPNMKLTQMLLSKGKGALLYAPSSMQLLDKEAGHNQSMLAKRRQEPLMECRPMCKGIPNPTVWVYYSDVLKYTDIGQALIMLCPGRCGSWTSSLLLATALDSKS
jgi:hypothetical protein